LRRIGVSPVVGDECVLLHRQLALAHLLGEASALEGARDGQEVGRALGLEQFQRALRILPRDEPRVIESIERHVAPWHLDTWHCGTQHPVHV